MGEEWLGVPGIIDYRTGSSRWVGHRQVLWVLSIARNSLALVGVS